MQPAEPRGLASSSSSCLLTSSLSDLLAQKDIVIRHFQIWFKLWARLPFIDVLHPKRTFTEIDEKRLNPNIGKLVCAVTARYLQPGSRELPAFAETCAKDVENYIMQNIGSFLRENGHENTIILLMMVGHFMVEQHLDKAWMFMGLAGRLVTALQLNWEGAGETPWEQESIRRAVWALWKLDRYFAGGFDEHLVLRDEVMHLRVPVSDEEIPDELSSDPPPAPSIKPTNLINAHHIRLHQLKHQILARTKMFANPTTHTRRDQQHTPSSVLLRNVNQLQIALSRFQESLPSSLKVADQTKINEWINTPQCSSFFVLHSTYWELHIDLYRFSIPGLREAMAHEVEQGLPRDFVVHSQKQAVGYAVCLSRFWQFVQDIVAQRPYVDGTERLITVDFPVVGLPELLYLYACLSLLVGIWMLTMVTNRSFTLSRVAKYCWPQDNTAYFLAWKMPAPRLFFTKSLSTTRLWPH